MAGTFPRGVEVEPPSKQEGLEFFESNQQVSVRCAHMAGWQFSGGIAMLWFHAGAGRRSRWRTKQPAEKGLIPEKVLQEQLAAGLSYFAAFAARLKRSPFKASLRVSLTSLDGNRIGQAENLAGAFGEGDGDAFG